MKRSRITGGGIEYVYTPSERARQARTKINTDMLPVLTDIVSILAEERSKPTVGLRTAKPGAEDDPISDKLNKLRILQEQLKLCGKSN